MRHIVRERQPIDLADFRQRHAKESDVGEVIREPFVLLDQGAVIAAYLDLAPTPARPAIDKLFEVLLRVHYRRSARTGGLVSTSRTFGYKPRNALRHDYCSAASLAAEQPEEHAAIASLAPIIGAHYREWAPDIYARHAALADERLLPEFRLEHEVFTSGIVNENNPLKYHFDAGNFVNVWSAMLAFKRDIAGGYLALPEYDLAVEIKDHSLFLFDGQSVLHGVTPIHKLSPTAVRYTVVFYSLREMWNCAPINDEIARIRALRTRREAQRSRKVAT